MFGSSNGDSWTPDDNKPHGATVAISLKKNNTRMELQLVSNQIKTNQFISTYHLTINHKENAIKCFVQNLT